MPRQTCAAAVADPPPSRATTPTTAHRSSHTGQRRRPAKPPRRRVLHARYRSINQSYHIPPIVPQAHASPLRQSCKMQAISPRQSGQQRDRAPAAKAEPPRERRRRGHHRTTKHIIRRPAAPLDGPAQRTAACRQTAARRPDPPPADSRYFQGSRKIVRVQERKIFVGITHFFSLPLTGL